MKWYQFTFFALIAFGIIGLVGYAVANSLIKNYIDEIVESRVQLRLEEMVVEAEESDEPSEIVEKLIDVRHIADRLDTISNMAMWVIYAHRNKNGEREYRVSVEIKQENPLVETTVRYDSNNLLTSVNEVLGVLELELIPEK
jgi:hypothetical protein